MIIPTFRENPQAAQSISAAIWRLSRPDAGELSTQYYCGWSIHPETGMVYLRIPDGDDQPVHPSADPEPLIELFTAVPEAEQTALRAAILAARGGRVVVTDLIPPTVMAGSLESWPESEVEE